jgi:site-specific recombinase XerD
LVQVRLRVTVEARPLRPGERHGNLLQRAVKAAVERAGLTKRASCHTLRHRSPRTCWRPATRTIQELLDHRDVSTTMIYTHVLNKGGRGVRSPFDDLG